MATAKYIGPVHLAKELGVSRALIYNMIHEGSIKAVKVGKKRLLIPASEYDRLTSDEKHGRAL